MAEETADRPRKGAGAKAYEYMNCVSEQMQNCREYQMNMQQTKQSTMFPLQSNNNRCHILIHSQRERPCSTRQVQSPPKLSVAPISKSVGRVGSFVRQSVHKMERVISPKSKASVNQRSPVKATYLCADGREGEGEKGGDEGTHLAVSWAMDMHGG